MEGAFVPAENLQRGGVTGLGAAVGGDELALVEDEFGLGAVLLEPQFDGAATGGENLDHFDEAEVAEVALDAVGGGGTGGGAADEALQFHGGDLDVVGFGVPVVGTEFEGLFDEVGVGRGVQDDGEVPQFGIVFNGAQEFEAVAGPVKVVLGDDHPDSSATEGGEGGGGGAGGGDLEVVVFEAELEELEVVGLGVHEEDAGDEEVHGGEGALVFADVEEGFEGVGVEGATGLPAEPVEERGFVGELGGLGAAQGVVGVHDAQDAGGGRGGFVGKEVGDGIRERDVGEEVESGAQGGVVEGVGLEGGFAEALGGFEGAEVVEVGGEGEGVEVAAVEAEALADEAAVLGDGVGVAAEVGVGALVEREQEAGQGEGALGDGLVVHDLAEHEFAELVHDAEVGVFGDFAEGDLGLEVGRDAGAAGEDVVGRQLRHEGAGFSEAGGGAQGVALVLQ